MSDAEMPIFTRSYDFLTWLLPATNDFPFPRGASCAPLPVPVPAFERRGRLSN